MVCALQALISLQVLEQRYQYVFYMHADDDSYVRLDLMLQLLVRKRLRITWPACRTAQHSIRKALAVLLHPDFSFTRDVC
jgi:hypothetical protein